MPSGTGLFTVSAGEFRSLMATFPSGVSVVTAFGPDGGPRGMTCSSLSSVALAPPTLLVSLRRGHTAAAVLEQRAFAVNLLHEDGRHVAALFAGTDVDRFARVRWQLGSVGPLLVEDAHRTAECVLVDTKDVGDHVVVFGEVRAVVEHRDRPPLLYGLRDYGRWSTAVSPTGGDDKGDSSA